MLKKKISFLTALVMMITMFAAQMPAQAKSSVVEDGYTIVDSVYNDGTYVIMAKNFDSQYHPTQLYVSGDGKTWVKTYSNSSGIKSGAPYSKQNLVWWEKEGVFVASVGNLILTSEDGTLWETNELLSSKAAYAHVDERDNVLAFVTANSGKISFATSLTEITEPVQIANNQFGSFGFTPNDDGSYGYWVMNRYEYYRETLGNTHWQGSRPDNTKDAKYIPSYDGWMLLYNGQPTLETMNYKADMTTVNVLVNEAAVTSNFSAIGADSKVLAAGTVDGKLYTMAAPASRPSGNTNWTEAEPAEGYSAISEEITDIIPTTEDNFMVTTKTGVYFMRKVTGGYEYYSAEDPVVKSIGDIRAIGKLPFDGVTILGGAYSPELDTYVAYGNDADKKGHIFYSTDGINWNTTGVGTETLTWGFDEQAKNVAVWWPAQKEFVISAATQNATQTLWHSKDGISWSFMNKTGFGDNCDISIVGDYLYSGYKSSRKAVRRFTALDGVFENVFYQRTDIAQYCTTMAVSDDEVPVILVGAGYGQTFVSTAKAEDDSTAAKLITPGGTAAASQMRDVSWNTNVDKFVGVNSANNQLWLIAADGTFEALRPNENSGILAAVETNGSSYLTGGANGTIYYSLGANISTSSAFSEVKFEGINENTLPVTNIFTGADGQYFVTVSDGTESDILIVNADGSAYRKASELTKLTSVNAGDTFRISAKATAAEGSFSMAVAIYDSEGKLLQVAAEDKTVTSEETQILYMDITAGSDIPADAKMKVFIWDSLNGMVPVAGEAKSFF